MRPTFAPDQGSGSRGFGVRPVDVDQCLGGTARRSRVSGRATPPFLRAASSSAFARISAASRATAGASGPRCGDETQGCASTAATRAARPALDALGAGVGGSAVGGCASRIADCAGGAGADAGSTALGTTAAEVGGGAFAGFCGSTCGSAPGSGPGSCSGLGAGAGAKAGSGCSGSGCSGSNSGCGCFGCRGCVSAAGMGVGGSLPASSASIAGSIPSSSLKSSSELLTNSIVRALKARRTSAQQGVSARVRRPPRPGAQFSHTRARARTHTTNSSPPSALALTSSRPQQVERSPRPG